MVFDTLCCLIKDKLAFDAILKQKLRKKVETAIYVQSARPSCNIKALSKSFTHTKANMTGLGVFLVVIGCLQEPLGPQMCDKRSYDIPCCCSIFGAYANILLLKLEFKYS